MSFVSRAGNWSPRGSPQEEPRSVLAMTAMAGSGAVIPPTPGATGAPAASAITAGGRRSTVPRGRWQPSRRRQRHWRRPLLRGNRTNVNRRGICLQPARRGLRVEGLSVRRGSKPGWQRGARPRCPRDPGRSGSHPQSPLRSPLWPARPSLSAHRPSRAPRRSGVVGNPCPRGTGIGPASSGEPTESEGPCPRPRRPRGLGDALHHRLECREWSGGHAVLVGQRVPRFQGKPTHAPLFPFS